MIYLDNNATTRLGEGVLDAMIPYLTETYGNASSIQHSMGRMANQAIENTRELVAQHLHVNSKEITFNSGSTEAISTVLKGVFMRYSSIGNHIITCSTEHKAVLESCEYLQKQGAKITYLPVNGEGQINMDELKEAISDKTILVCLMSANNETGVLHPLAEIAAICQNKDVLFFCDATQSIGKHPIDLSKIPIDILCFSAHKLHGPKGIAALYVRRKSKPVQIEPMIIGGKQENGFRAGTYPVATIVGMGRAVQEVDYQVQQEVAQLRNYLEQRLEKEIEECKIIGKNASRIGNTSNVLFKHVKSTELMTKLPKIAISNGSACVSGDRDPSHVLIAMGLSPDDAHCCVRFSFSKFNKREEIEIVIEQLKSAINQIRSSSPVWQMYKAGLLD